MHNATPAGARRPLRDRGAIGPDSWTLLGRPSELRPPGPTCAKRPWSPPARATRGIRASLRQTLRNSADGTHDLGGPCRLHLSTHCLTG
ncbi:hypothetical protein NDU88_005849 [Pleurodeles waltl]|uniref:Uncharacterized protein n=1 Tax=Pleurodeles waltl TaxID=8319 RepID=A0AAV7MXJ1_PLEWA|nr:hypothetical protein NDU88_005849 [Pleurodeles waltl]